MKTPEYWKNKNLISMLLAPLGFVYEGITHLRFKIKKGYKAPVPVICIGNITTGGVGKTPVAIEIAKILQKRGKNPFFISRGYGGKLKGVLVDFNKHRPEDVGDEPLLLAKVAPTVVCPNRKEGAKIAVERGADILIMDDGFQNPSLKKDVSLLVFNGQMGIGNGKIIPAGPMRESLSSGLKRAQGVIFIGKDKSNLISKISLPVFKAEIKEEKPVQNTRPILAFAGIGYPQKFYDSLIKSGLTIAKVCDFPDHHFYTLEELQKLIQKAQKKNLDIYTTAKDFVKIPSDLKKYFYVLNINAVMEDENALVDFLEKNGVL